MTSDPTPLKIIPRISWSGTRVSKKLHRLFHPVNYVLFTYALNPPVKVKRGKSIRTVPDPEYLECISKLEYGNEFVREKVEDIRYNFMIEPRGHVFEGRGWHKRPALPTRYIPLRDSALYIAFLGNYKKSPPPDELFRTRQRFIYYGIKYRYISKKCNEITIS